MFDNQTIAAVATPVGRGGVGIIRISGTSARHCAQRIVGHVPKTRYAEYVGFNDENGRTIDRGIALFFAAPNSYTGEDVLELQAHGGSAVLDLLLKEVLKTENVRQAGPGEFTQRAFLNDKMDLAQAEAVADLIEASSEQAVRSANNSLNGEFSARVHELTEKLINLRTYIEAAIDFPEEDGVDYLAAGGISEKTEELLKDVNKVKQAALNGAALREGMKIVIAGRPNAGKSSLLNRLSGQETAIVTSIAGTTRDTLREQIFIDGMPLHIIDTAGLRDTDDEVEKIGVTRAWKEISDADMVLLVIDATVSDSENQRIIQDITEKIPDNLKICIVLNKTDLIKESKGGRFGKHAVIEISAKTGDGIDRLRNHLKSSMGYTSCTEGSFTARRRHLEAIDAAQSHILLAKQQLDVYAAGELAAEELRFAQNSLNEITGEFTSDDLLTRIFSSFCIGK